MNWCVIIPTYNNGRTLEKLLNDVLKVTADIIVVNDGSVDETAAILARYNQIAVIQYPLNKGKGYALRKGFERAIADGFTHAVTIDSDGQHYPADILSFVSKAEEFPEAIIVGTRTLPHDRMSKGSSFANRFSNFWFRFISGESLPDTQSGFRLYPLAPIRPIRFYTYKYEFEIEVLVRSAWRGVKLMNIPIGVHYPGKDERVSHFRPFRDFMRISLLNAILVLVALFYAKPFSFVRYLRKENVRDFLKRNVLQTGDSVEKVTFSVMLGVFMGIVPIWGYQLITAIALAYLLKLNKFIVIVAANISIPPMIPLILYLSYVTGGWILSSDKHTVFSSEISLAWVRDNLFQYIIGSITFAVIVAVIFGILTFILLRIFRRKPLLIE
ncbi:MAG: DUF2062 domain-containing protein [Bacteroidales bacterium]|nr:DUF2062 domain-containing protein [Bacteroidales bacterium]